MFTSLLNTVCAYDPVGYGVPYNHLLFTDSLEPLVDVALQILIVTLDHDTTGGAPLEEGDNLFINYLSRIHRDEGNILFYGGLCVALRTSKLEFFVILFTTLLCIVLYTLVII